MIVTPFYSKIIVKDYDFSDEWTEELIFTLKFLSLDKENNCSLTKMIKERNIHLDEKYDWHKITKPYIIHEETAVRYPIIAELRSIFIDGFQELNREYNYQYDESYLNKVYLQDSGNFAIVKPGQRVGIHDHPSIAFAIFYLSDINNKDDGGELVLHDPSFNRNISFHPQRQVTIQTKKNRLVIGPANVWHEVDYYHGNEDRLCAVIDLKRES